jgi:hypothetical protein
MLALHETVAAAGVKGVVLLANPTQSHPLLAHDSTISVLELALVIMTIPLIGTPALTFDVVRLKRIDTGDLVAALAAETPEEIERRTNAMVSAILFFLMAEDYKSVGSFYGRDMLACAPLGLRGAQVRLPYVESSSRSSSSHWACAPGGRRATRRAARGRRPGGVQCQLLPLE